MRQLTAIIEREADLYVALCPELDIASQGETVETARTNLIEALELFFESADPTEVARRLHSKVFVTRVEVALTVPVPDHSELKIGTLTSIIRQSGVSRSLFES
jgi:predicted RNase H-like HicB family nuclease